MSWIDIKQDLPKYYQQVLVMLKSGNYVVSWLAVTDDGCYIWTINTTNICLDDRNIIKWKYIE